ncbi:MAG: hypothetical protein KDK24_10135 [Pseudooceanicola sp.]|nr:hypothetical protein [Pseudooceanicola sp.]
MNQIIEFDGQEIAEVDDASTVARLARAEIDIQVATAHKWPREISRVVNKIKSLVTISQEAAQECMYALPRGGKPIVGPSIRLAEIVASQWGNCRQGARIVDVDRKNGFVEAEGLFHDLESNSATVKRVRRRIFDKNGKCFNDDMILVTGNAACSIALRNAIFGGVPKAVWNEAYKTAERTVKGDIKTLPERRTAALTAMAAFGLKPEQVWAILGIAGEKDCGLDQLVELGGYHQSLKDGEITVEQLLAEAAPEEKRPERQTGSITNRPADTRAREPEQKPAPKKEETPAAPVNETAHDPETGEVTEEDTGPAPAQMRAMEKWIPVANTIKADLDGASDVEEVVELYAGQMLAMKAEAPDIHADLEKEIAAYREAAAKGGEAD